MLTQKMSGWFDCRKYKEGQDRAQRALLSESDVITFNTTFALAELPADIAEFAHEYVSKDATDGKADRASVAFKIGRSCKWFDEFGQECARPKNTDLDSVLIDGRFEVQIDFTVLRPVEGKPLSPRGYWANAIMYRKAVDNPFAGHAFTEAPDGAAHTTQIPVPPTPHISVPELPKANEPYDLPF